MPNSTPLTPLTDPLRTAIADCGLPLLTLAERTGVQRASLMRFLRGERSLRLDKADILAEFFGLSLQPTPQPTIQPTKQPAKTTPKRMGK